MHADASAGDSLACDLMEPVRLVVDAFVLDYLGRRTLSKADCFKLRNGHCLLLPPVTSEVAQSASRWARLVLPVAQDVAGQLQSTLRPATKQRPASRGQRVVVREFGAGVAPIAVSDPRRSVEAGVRRRRAMKGVQSLNARWNDSADPPRVDEYRATILPNLRWIPLKHLSERTGLTKSACSRMRPGQVVPHPRHWHNLGLLSMYRDQVK